MKRLSVLARFFVFVVWCLPPGPVWSADTGAVATGGTATVTADTLQARLAEIESSTTLDEETRASLTETINKALTNLETARNNKTTTESYVQLRKTSPAQVKTIRTKLDKAKEAPEEIAVSATSDTALYFFLWDRE